jgi:hypothetical protein
MELKISSGDLKITRPSELSRYVPSIIPGQERGLASTSPTIRSYYKVDALEAPAMIEFVHI